MRHVPDGWACGDYSRTTEARYVEVLEFSHFVTIYEFDRKKQNGGQKRMIDRITVSVVLDLDCGNTEKGYTIEDLSEADKE